MISSALGIGLNAKQLEQKNIESIADAMYKNAMLGLQKEQFSVDRPYKEALTEQALAAAEKQRPSITIPGTDIKVTSEQYVDWWKTANKDERTSAIKNYEYAQSQGFTGSFEQFQDSAKTTHQKDFDRARAEGYGGSFNQWLLDLAKAGAMSLGDIVQRKEATEDIDAKKYFTSPKGLVADVDKYIASDAVQNPLIRFAADPKQLEKETVRLKESFIRGKITGSGGSIVGERLEGRTFVFTVKWPDGSTSEVRYAN